MDKPAAEERKKPPKVKANPTVSAVLDDGRLVELVFDPAARRTGLAVWDGADWSIEGQLRGDDGNRLVPYSASNNLLKNKVVLLPARPEEYDGEEALFAEIRDFIHRYVDVSGRFERIAAFYVLFTWVYDCFNEVPYLRLRGDYGSGKTRFLLTVGSLCYKPIFASGASTVSPIFHTLDAFRGTLIVDEGDFRFSDEKADIVKILNNGNVKGMPVLRCESVNGREFNPRAFQVFGPKLVAMRGHYDDRALESRFVTEETGGRKLRADVPINLPDACQDEARALRDKLLLYRFRTRSAALAAEPAADDSVEPRLRQILAPLAAVTFDDSVRSDLWGLAREANADLAADRGLSIEAQLLAVIGHLARSNQRLTIAEIAAGFRSAFGGDYDRPVTNKWIGHLIRKRLFLKTYKSNGIYVIAATESGRLAQLYERFGVGEDEITLVAVALGAEPRWELEPSGT